MATQTQVKPKVINPLWKSVPPLGCSDDDASKFMVRHFNEKSAIRLWESRRAARNLWMYLGRHWTKEPSRLIATATGGAYRFANIDRKSAASFPMPVDNIIADGVDNIVARLGRREFEPTTRATKNDPTIEAAARLAKDVLLFDLEEQLWADKREELNFNLVISGTAVARSLWDETATELSVLAAVDAVACPMCSTKLASARVPMETVRAGLPGEPGAPRMPMQHMETLREVERVQSRPEEVQVTHCPTCVEPVALVPTTVSVEEAMNDQDTFGRPMGEAVPAGKGLIEIPFITEMFVQNGGVGCEPDTCRVWGQKTVRDMEWIATHIPEYADRINPEAASELMETDPILGDEAFSGSSLGSSEDVYSNHCAVQELYIEPIPLPGLENGRRFWKVADHICRNDELMTEVEVPNGEPRKIPRVKYAAARYKRIPKRFHGRTPVDDAVPLNKALNELDAMDQDIRYKGYPRVFVPPGTEIIERDDAEGALDYVEFDCPTQDWSPKDGLFAGTPMTGNAYLPRRQVIVDALNRVLRNPVLQRGENPKGVKSGEHLQILADEAAQNQSPLERSMRQLSSTIFTHHLEVTWASRREQTEIEKQRSAGAFERDSYAGVDLLGQTTVKVESKGAVDLTFYESAAIEKGVGMGLYDLSTEAAREDMRERLNLPSLETAKSLQIIRAEQAFREFINNGKIPIIDPTIHDPWIRFQVLGKRWESDECIQKRRAANFDETVLPRIAGWDRKLGIAEKQNMTALAAYEGLPPEQWVQIYQEAGARAQAAGMPNPMPPPPQNGFLPESITARILLVMDQMFPLQAVQGVADVGVLKADSPTKQTMMLQPLREFYVVIQGYRLLDQANKAAAAGGAQIEAAPGGGRTPQGMVPQEGQPVMPAPGTGGV